MKIKAIYALYPQVKSTRENKAFDLEGNEVELDQALIDAWVDPDQYKADRQRAYPSFAEQLDTLYHGGYDAWRATIQAIKDKYPKG